MHDPIAIKINFHDLNKYRKSISLTHEEKTCLLFPFLFGIPKIEKKLIVNLYNSPEWVVSDQYEQFRVD